MFGKKRAPKNIKKREAVDDVDKDAEEVQNAVVSSETDNNETVFSLSEKKRRVYGKAPIVMTTQKKEDLGETSSVKRHTYESERTLNIGCDQRATATADYDTEHHRDNRAILERNEAIGKALLAGELEEGIYRGLDAIRPVISRREGAIAAGKSTGHYGPVRGNQHVRMTMRIDLNPEICKDYKETGYCGFGDTCIFLHDRSDYKSGWQLEKEWEQQQKAKQARDARRLKRIERRLRREAGETADSGDEVSSQSQSDSDDDDDGSEDEVSKTCQICNCKWELSSRPVATLCKHYFCENCALKHYSTSPNCAVCKAATNGVFNTASALVNRLQEDAEVKR